MDFLYIAAVVLPAAVKSLVVQLVEERIEGFLAAGLLNRGRGCRGDVYFS